MKNYEFEDIDTARLQQGIDDVELRGLVEQLTAGDCIRLTVLSAAKPNNTLMVRVTAVKDGKISGRLIQDPPKHALCGLRLGDLLRFKGVNVHSIVRSKTLE